MRPGAPSLRFGLIGGGLAGPLFGGAFQQHPGGSSLVAVATRHEDTARAAADRWGAAKAYADWRALIDDPEVDAICIASPTGTHAEIAIAAAQAGKHVLTEKPMAATLEQADAMIEAAASADVRLGVIFMYRFMDTARKIKEAVDKQLIGKALFGECVDKSFRSQAYYDSGEWRGNWVGEGGGSLMTQASHTIDLLIWILGAVESVTGYWTTTELHDIEVDDLAVAALRFRSGTLGLILGSSAMQPPQPRSLTVHGTTGTVGLRGDRISRWDTESGADPSVQAMMEVPDASRGDTTSRPGYVDPELHRRQIEDFVQAVHDHRPPAIDGVEGRRTLEVIQAIYMSSNQRQVIPIPVPVQMYASARQARA
jgi:predicted dehydrogenase